MGHKYPSFTTIKSNNKFDNVCSDRLKHILNAIEMKNEVKNYGFEGSH